MPNNFYRIRTGATGTPSGRELIDTMETLGQAYATVRRIFAAMTAQKDGNAGTAADYVTSATLFGFADEADVISPQMAGEAYGEMNAFLAAAGPALEQCTSRFKQ